MAADGGRIENQGEISLNMIAKDSGNKDHVLQAKYQVAEVTRALLSVGLIEDAGLDCKFNKAWAKVLDGNGKELMYFSRKHGLYMATVKVPNPLYKGFQRQGANQ